MKFIEEDNYTCPYCGCIVEREELPNAPEFKDGTPENKIRLWYLGESIKKIGEADVFIGSNYDGMYPGCDVEQETARRYGIHMIYLPESIVFDIMPDVEEAILKRWDNCAKAGSIIN